MQNRTAATVYFTTRWRFSFARIPVLLRAVRRRPFLIGRVVRLVLIRVLSGSDLTHVAVAVEGVVLCPYLSSDRLWGELLFRECYPGIAETIFVPITRVPDLEAWMTEGKKSTLRCLIRWASGGRIRGHDCVTVVSDVLRAAGVAVPETVCTPFQLQTHLLSQGNTHEPE